MLSVKESVAKKRKAMLRHLQEQEKWSADLAFQAGGGLGKYALSALLCLIAVDVLFFICLRLHTSVISVEQSDSSDQLNSTLDSMESLISEEGSGNLFIDNEAAEVQEESATSDPSTEEDTSFSEVDGRGVATHKRGHGGDDGTRPSSKVAKKWRR